MSCHVLSSLVGAFTGPQLRDYSLSLSSSVLTVVLLLQHDPLSQAQGFNLMTTVELPSGENDTANATKVEIVWFVRCSGLAFWGVTTDNNYSVLEFLTFPRAQQCMGFSCLDPSFSAGCPFSLPGPSPVSTTQRRTSC